MCGRQRRGACQVFEWKFQKETMGTRMRVGGELPSRNWVLDVDAVNLVGVCVGVSGMGMGERNACFCIGKWVYVFCSSARRNPACAKRRVIASVK
jgi:hypothetical protein